MQADSLEEVVLEALRYIREDNFFIEDSGLFVEALNGFPGVYSAYVFKTLGYKGLIKLMEGEENRRAYFESVVGLRFRGEVKIFRGRVYGTIAERPSGEKGFGYDPVFIPEGYNVTFAQSPEIKNRVSHRKRALEQMHAYLLEM